MALNQPRPEPEYDCTEAELYTICDLGWASCREHGNRIREDFPIYTEDFIDLRLAEVSAALKLPDEEQRGEDSESLRIVLVGVNNKGLIAWRKLERHILRTFGELAKPKVEAAGKEHYNTAYNSNWENATLLYKNGLDFIKANEAQLIEKGMPEGFSAKFEELKMSFDKQSKLFMQAKRSPKALRDDKVKANNGIYRALMDMFDDVELSFTDNAAIRESFVFDRLKATVSTRLSSGGEPGGSIDAGAE